MRSEVRTSVKVQHAGTVITMDGATIEKGVDYIVHKDRGSLKISTEKCESHLNSKDTIKTLEKLKAENKLPLVLCTDNGSPFCCKDVDEYLDKNYIIHLKNLPRVPQHNGACEVAVREFKELFVENFSEEKCVISLNEYRRRKTINWLTAREFEETNFKQYTTEQRIHFYETTKSEIESTSIGIQNAKEKRKKEREAILKTMESFELIQIIRGKKTRYPKAEEIA